jgi:carbonic anhydrase
MIKILNGVREFHERAYFPRKDLFDTLSQGQRPQACLITCADSRICPELLTGCDPGDLFVLRNAGNLVPPAETPVNSEAAGIEIALAVGVRDVIVCGHSDCGAMKELFDPEVERKFPATSSWLQHACETRRRVTARVDSQDLNTLIWTAVKENVLVQLEHLRGLPAVQRAVGEDKLRLHGWVYRIESGEVLAYDEKSNDFKPLRSSKLTNVA